MPAVTNLTFAEVNAEATTPVFSYAGGDVTLSLADLTGDTYTGLSDPAVVEAVWKLLELCSAAQVTVNDGVADADQLTAFPTKAVGTFNPTTFTLPMSHIVYAEITANPDVVTGQYGV